MSWPTSLFTRLFLIFFLHFTAMCLWANTPLAIERLQKQLDQVKTNEERVELMCRLGRLKVYNDPKGAERFVKEAMELALELDYQKGIALAHQSKGVLLLESGDHDGARSNYQKALAIVQQEGIKKTEANIFIDLGYVGYRSGDSTKTINNYRLALELHNELGDPLGKAKANLKIGWGYDYFGNTEKAREHFSNAVEQSQLTADTTLIIGSLTGAAAFRINKGIEQHEALELLLRALDLSKKSKDIWRVASVYKGIGLLYTNLGQIETARSYYLDGLELFSSVGYDSELCWLNRAMGELYAEEENYDQAEFYYKIALGHVESSNFKEYNEALLYGKMGEVYQYRDEDHEKALANFQKAFAFAESHKDRYLSTMLKANIGICYNALGKYEDAKHWCSKAEQKAEPYLQISLAVCKCLYDAHREMADYKTALTYQDEYLILMDSMHQQELSEEINNLAAKKEYEKELATLQKDQEIEAERTRTKTTLIIGVIILVSILIIMWLLLVNTKRTAQKNQIQALANLRRELIANISHDLRTPITVMQGYIETLLMKINTVSKADNERYLNVLLSNAERLAAMVSQLFEYSKLEAKQITLHKEHFLINELVGDIFQDYKLIAEKKGVHIHIEQEAQIPGVFADIVLIERVIQNLMNNALKYTPEKGQITIQISNKAKAVEVEISDTGKGISQEKLPYIFNRYHKGHNSTGAGLGLTIVKMILELHGSSIQVNSVIDEGTTFVFALPVHDLNQTPVELPA